MACVKAVQRALDGPSVFWHSCFLTRLCQGSDKTRTTTLFITHARAFHLLLLGAPGVEEVVSIDLDSQTVIVKGPATTTDLLSLLIETGALTRQSVSFEPRCLPSLTGSSSRQTR